MSGSYFFDGSNDEFTALSSPLANSNPFTMCALVNSDASVGVNTFQTVCELWNSGLSGTSAHFGLAKKNTNLMYFTIEVFLSGGSTLTFGTGWNADTWYIIGARRTGTGKGSMKGWGGEYLGTKVTGTRAVTQLFAPDRTHIGRLNNNNFPFGGYIAWVAVWDQSLSTINEDALMAGANPNEVSVNDLRSVWYFNGVDSPVKDIHGNNLSLTKSGAVEGDGAQIPMCHINSMGGGYNAT